MNMKKENWIDLLLFIAGLIFLGFMLSKANAQECRNWISVSELQRSQNGEAAKAGCKKNEKCFCYDGVDLRDAKIGMKSVDDFDKPIYEDDEELGRIHVGFEQKEVEALIIDEDKKSQRLQSEQLAKQKREEAEEKQENMRRAFQAWKEESFIENGRVINPEEARQRARNQRSVSNVQKNY